MDTAVLGGTAVLAAGLGSYFAARDDTDTPTDILTAKRLRWYPYLAGLSLVSLNLLLEYLGQETVNLFFMFYFALAGTNSIWFLVRSFIPYRGPRLGTYPQSYIMLTEFVLPPSPVPFYLRDLLIYPFAIAINVLYYKTSNPWVNNAIAFSIGFYAVLSIRIEKFTAAAPLLWSLLIYDVFFVYSTDVMANVAAHLDGPVKLVFRSATGSSVLGLGDIVLPGLFLSVCSRFDAFLFRLLKRKTPYWIVAMVAYASAVLLTDVVCWYTHSGQPALLFITPILTIAIVTLAIVRQEHLAFLSFSG
jgi:minor histocompatibility antigen H13